MLKTIRNAWRVEEIRQKIIFTFFIILLYRLGNAVPVPWVDTALLQDYFRSLQNTILGLYNVMSGSAFSQATIFALSIQPYINASIIIQLLCVAIPALERMSKDEGEEGRKKIASITRYATVGIALLQGFAYFILIRNNNLLVSDAPTIWAGIVIVMTFTAGSALLMWLGEQITEFGIGNGISIILFVSIVSRIPNTVASVISRLIEDPALWWLYLLFLIGSLAIIVLIVIVNDSERRIPVQYAKRVVGRKVYGGQASHLPIKVNMAGVLPVIFAQSIASIPGTFTAFVSEWQDNWFARITATTSPLYAICYFLLILFFSYFYSTIQFNPVEVSNNIKKNGGYIPGFRPGKPTADFIDKVLKKVTLFGAIYLAIIAVTPVVLSACSETVRNAGVSFGGTSLIIVVGVAIETVKALEAQIMMRHYKGFLE